MRKANKAIAILMVVLMMLTTIPMAVIANALETAENAAQVTVESVNAVPGSTVEVNVDLSNNTGILAAAFTLTYDEGLTLIDATSGDAFSALAMTKPASFSSPCKFAWDAYELSEEDIKDGTILTLSFQVAEDIPPNTKLNIKLSYASKDVIDSNLQTIPVSIDNGSVTVIDYIPGDLNGDGEVTTMDITLIRRLITGYDVSVNESAADVNGDGEVTMMDVVLIRRYVVDKEGYGIVLLPAGNKHTHEMTEYPEKAATCTEDGNIHYWYCSSCDKYYTDAEGNNEVSQNDTVIKSKGHVVVIDPAVEPTYESTGLTEGSHCSVCHKVLQAQEVIPKLQKTEYSITYHISNGDEYLAKQNIDNSSNPSVYTSEEGVAKFANPSVPGYQFLGWYDLPSGDAAENIKSIPSGTTGNIDLYAKWEKIPYKVSFSSDLIPVESEHYTVDENHVLPSPKLDGYIFAGWSDDEGSVIKTIPSGTVGGKTYTANWLSERNQAWTKKDVGDPIIYEDPDTYTILFAYNIGEIRNVPLYVIHDFGKINSDGVSKEVTKTFATTVSTEEMEKYTNTVQKATTDSFSWSLSKDWTNSTTVNESWCEERGITKEEANTICKNDSQNWYVSSGNSGSTTTESLENTDTYDLNTHTTNKTSSESSSTTKHQDFSANLEVSAPIKVVNVKGGVSYSNGKSTTNEDSSESSKGDSAQTGSISHTGENTTTTGSWNSESGYGGSSSISESSTISQALSEKISQEYGYGKSYVESEGQSTQQGLTSAHSNTDEYSSSVTYSLAQQEEVTTTFSTSNTKSGYHRWIMAGTAHVFAVVGYDIKTNAYFTYTYTVMDDEMHEFEDYSYDYASYDDNQNSVIPFEVPYEIVQYVSDRVGSSDGFEVSKDGVVTDYTGTDDFVLMPEYKVIDNYDGTKSVIKIVAITEDTFKENANISTVVLSDFITEIPNNAFYGCTSLKQFAAASITTIGDNAFAGCTNLVEGNIDDKVTRLGINAVTGLNKLTVKAANVDVLTAATQSGSKEISVGISDKCTDIKDIKITIPASVEKFQLNGYGQTFNNLYILSNAAKTVINRLNLICSGQTPLVISSADVELHEVNVESPGICLALTAETTNLALRGESTLSAASGNSMLCKEISLSQIDPALSTSLTVDGNLLIYSSEDSILSGEKFLNVTGKIIGVSASEFENYLKGVYTANFDANGGSVSEASRTVVYGSALGTLPVPTKDYYSFDGWYTAATGGEKVTAATVFTSTEDVTYYAHWTENPTSDWILADDLPENAKVVDEKWTYDLTSTTTSSASSLAGWTKYDTKRTGWGATQGPVYSNPSNGSRNVWSEQYETSRTPHYNYYHRHVNSSTVSPSYTQAQWDAGQVHLITLDYELAQKGTSSEGGIPYYGYYSTGGCPNIWYKNGTYITYTYTYGTRWYYQEPVYTYYYKKTEAKESATEVTASGSISNIQKYVKYVEK